MEGMIVWWIGESSAAPLRRLMLAGQLNKAKAGRTEPAVGFGFVVVFACAVRAGTAAPQKKKTSQTKQNQQGASDDRATNLSGSLRRTNLFVNEAKKANWWASSSISWKEMVGAACSINSAFLPSTNQHKSKKFDFVEVEWKRNCWWLMNGAHTSIPSIDLIEFHSRSFKQSMNSIPKFT